MPTYDYKCSGCDHTFEEFQSITAKPLRKCPACGKATLKRLIGTGAGVIFKGSGFYQTDYRSESYKAAAKADSSSAGTASSGSESKSDSSNATATKAESTPKPAKTESKPAAKAKETKAKTGAA